MWLLDVLFGEPADEVYGGDDGYDGAADFLDGENDWYYDGEDDWYEE